MPKPKRLNLSVDRVSQTIDLKEIFGFDVSRNKALKEAAAQMVIDHIISRTHAGHDYNGVKISSYAPYSESYKDSVEFKAFRKNNTVDMTLTGEMLGTLDIISMEGNEVEIGWSDGSQSAKAYGHMTGFKGHPTLAGHVEPRLFFGVTPNELTDIGRTLKPDASPEASRGFSDSTISNLLKFFEDKQNGNGV